MSRLEALVAPDAATHADAQLDNVADPPWLVDAALDAARGTADASDALIAVTRDCAAVAERQCTRQMLRDRVRLRERGPRWTRTDPPPRADSTPAGKACVERARKECEEGGPRSAELQWLDAQLLKAKKDVAFTNEIRARIAKLADAAADGFDVECVAEFCRIAPKSPAHDGGSFSPLGLRDGFDGHLQDGQTWYAIRRGYRLVR